tara:strand:+ start:453 stop:1220 length:768 start_codon:yes stop_codon:yes gene_type:complete
MSLENHLVLYQAGHAGTFLVWLINQHKNFSQYDLQWKYTKAGDKLDLGCFGADWYHDDETFAESRSNWLINLVYDGATLNPDMIPRNKKRTKDAIKIVPNHCCQTDLVYFDGKIDETLLEKVMGEVKPKSIIIPVAGTHLKDEILNRWMAWRKENIPVDKVFNTSDRLSESMRIFTDNKKNPKGSWKQLWWNKTFPWLKENAWRYGDNSHTIDVGKIIMNVESEYLKLCAIIDEEPLKNIKELTRPMRELMESYK